jgi:hypothetical protein
MGRQAGQNNGPWDVSLHRCAIRRAANSRLAVGQAATEKSFSIYFTEHSFDEFCPFFEQISSRFFLFKLLQ